MRMSIRTNPPGVPFMEDGSFTGRCARGSTSVRPSSNRNMTGVRLVAKVAMDPRPTQAAGPVQMPPGTAFDEKSFARHWEGLRAEESYWIEPSSIEGQIPAELEGTFFRAGPGITEINGAKLHPFDGHGAVARVGVKDGRAHFSVKFVRTPAYLEEVVEKKAITYRGFGTKIPGGPLANIGEFRDKKVANTSVAAWGGKVYALWEGDRATILDPVSLDTLGEEDLQGAVPEGRPMSAHPHYDSNSGRLVHYGSGARSGNLWIWEVDEKSQVKVSKEFKFDAPPPYLHDFIVTPNYYIFHCAPLGINPSGLAKYLLGLEGQAKMARFDKEGKGKWVLLPRKSANPPITIECPAQFVWHFANAYEEDGKVVVDAVTYEEFDLGGFDMFDHRTIPRGLLFRHTLDLQKNTAERNLMTQWSGDFPRVNEGLSAKKSRYVYMAAVGDSARTFPFQSVVKVDTETKKIDSYCAPPNCFVGEALFVPAKSVRGQKEVAPQDEDKGFVVTLEYNGDAHRSDLIILDARALHKGPLCRIKLKAHLPFAFHNGFSQEAFLPAI